MDSGNYNGGNGSGHDQKISNLQESSKKPCNRHTTHQIQQLNSFFKDRPYPNEEQIQQLSRDLCLEPKQIKFWFQNKRTQNKAQNEHTENNSLRIENERIHFENLAIREALKNVMCAACGNPLFEEERRHDIQQLKTENAVLKRELRRLSLMLANTSTGEAETSSLSLTSPSLQSSSNIPPGFLGLEDPSLDPYKST